MGQDGNPRAPALWVSLTGCYEGLASASRRPPLLALAGRLTFGDGPHRRNMQMAALRTRHRGCAMLILWGVSVDETAKVN